MEPLKWLIQIKSLRNGITYQSLGDKKRIFRTVHPSCIRSSVSHTLKISRVKTHAISTSVFPTLAHSTCSVSISKWINELPISRFLHIRNRAQHLETWGNKDRAKNRSRLAPKAAFPFYYFLWQALISKSKKMSD